MDRLDYIRENFRSVLDGSPNTIYIVLIAMLLAPYIYFFIRRGLERALARKELLQELRSAGLSGEDCRLALRTAYGIDRERPSRMLSSVALFNHHVDRLSNRGIDRSQLEGLERVRKALFPPVPIWCTRHSLHATFLRARPSDLARQGVAGRAATCLVVHNDLSCMKLRLHDGTLAGLKAADELTVYFPPARSHVHSAVPGTCR